MNTIKFSPINDERKETNNVEVFSIKEKQIGGNIYKYYSNSPLTVYVTNRCNANCPFCINNYQSRFNDQNSLSDKEYLNTLDNLLNSFKDVKPRIIITGGEPTKSERLVSVLRKIKDHDYKVRTFLTNGSGLFDLYEGKPVIYHLLENGVVNNINVTRMATDDVINKELMKIDTRESNNVLIKKISRFCKTNNMDVRLSCNLLKKGVNNLGKILNYVEFYENIGLETMMFRELISVDNILYQQQKIDIINIIDEIKKSDKFIYIRTLNGMYYNVEVYRYNNYLVKCYIELSEKNTNIIKDFVFYNDARLEFGFDKNDRINISEGVKK